MIQTSQRTEAREGLPKQTQAHIYYLASDISHAARMSSLGIL